MTTAEQFLASQGIKFRVVPAKRGPGEWNVTFSRKGGGRLTLYFYQDKEPRVDSVIRELILSPPSKQHYAGDMTRYEEDVKEHIKVTKFLQRHELMRFLAIREGQG